MFPSIPKMTMIGGFVFFCCFIGVSFARTEQEIKKAFVQTAVDCTKEIPVSGEEFQKLKDTHIAENENVKCLVKCVLQKQGMVDEKGMFDEESSIKNAEKEYADNKDKLENAKKLYSLCKKVNDEQINNDNKGCERAAHLSNCLTENAPKMGFDIQ